jgi:D-alanyl-D-alanine carboxypeptidase/D-alanyl-D-alanine-endopeptidase (penicillin-binding protein 4)
MFVMPSPASATTTESDLFSKPWNRQAQSMKTVQTAGMPAWLSRQVELRTSALQGELAPVSLRTPLTFSKTSGTCTVNTSAVGLHHARVLAADVSTGKVLVAKDASSPVVTASTTKIATAVAALKVLGTDSRQRTTVLTGSQPGQIVLVGAGDATLSASAQNWYGTSDGIADLAAQVQAWSTENGQPVTQVLVDAGLFSGPAWLSSWPESYRTGGVQAPITALTLDGGRDNAAGEYSSRTTDPAGAAGRALAERLGLSDAAVTTGSAPSGAATIAAHDSPTVGDEVRFMLAHSDNTLADTLAHLVMVQLGQKSSFQNITAAYRTIFSELGLSLRGSHFADASGLSHDTVVAPRFLVSLLRMSVLSPKAAPVWEYLATGTDTSSTLRGRLQNLSPETRAQVRAKTGTLEDATALAGTVPAASGQKTVVFFIAEEQDANSAAARTGIDAVVGSLATCE